MTDTIRPLLTVGEADDAEMCGPDGCMLPANHPANAVADDL